MRQTVFGVQGLLPFARGLFKHLYQFAGSVGNGLLLVGIDDGGIFAVGGTYVDSHLRPAAKC